MTFSRMIPAMPAVNIDNAVAFYETKLGFTCPHKQEGFARVLRDGVELHLWAASDESWKSRDDVAVRPVCTGAETFIAGTHSFRVELTKGSIDALFEEMRAAAVLHKTSSKVVDQPWGLREFHAVDLDGNLITFCERS